MEFEHLDALRKEEVPSDLHERIVGRILNEPKREKRNRSVYRALTSMAFVAIFVGGIIVAQNASAVTIPKIHENFAQQDHYTVRTYRVEGESKIPVAETRIDGANVSVFMIDANGERRPLSAELERVSALMKEKFEGMTSESISQPQALEKTIQVSSIQVLGTPSSSATAISPQQIDIKQLNKLTEQLQKVVDDLKKLLDSSANGAVLLNGDSGTKYTDRLLSNSDLWERRSSERVDGVTMNHFVLKQSPENCDMFVDPASKLPMKVKIRCSFGDLKIAIENDYDYTK